MSLYSIKSFRIRLTVFDVSSPEYEVLKLIHYKD